MRHSILLTILMMIVFSSCKKETAKTSGGDSLPFNHTYITDDETAFLNPGRGWFYTIDPDYFTNTVAAPLTVTQLTQIKANFNVNLVRKYYLLYPYRSTNLIPASFINDQLLNDINVCRQAGFKLIPRFIYCWNNNFEQGANRDAPIDVTLSHINQLMPVLNDNIDVIDHLQAGFIGQYGEWHDSFYGHISDNSTLQLSNSGMQIINALYDKFSKKRMIAFRYSHTFRQIYNATLVSDATAFNESNLSRSGLANDGFAYDERDFGTWPVPLGSSPDFYRPYMRLQTQYTVASGEPAGGAKTYTKQQFSKDLELFHYSSLSMNQFDAEHDGLYSYLKSTGEYNNAAKKLGYRYSLVNAFIPETAALNQNITIKLSVINNGWAALYNERKVKLVFKNKIGGVVFTKDLTTDPRFWLPRVNQDIKEEVSLNNVPAGIYSVYLFMPDIALPLQTNSAYSIRLANKDLWDASTGYNSLQAEIKIN
jgi:hypothetical protein